MAAERALRDWKQRAAGTIVGYQRWEDALFLHWPVAPEHLRPQVDERLELDLHEGRAYVSLIPFTVRDARLRGLPRLPLFSEFHELNLRTYVRREGGDPGVWFFSLDAASGPAAALARASLALPYYRARIDRRQSGDSREFQSVRTHPRREPATFEASWTAGAPLPIPPGSLEHFLVERLALYTRYLGSLLRVRVRHAPWALRSAEVERLDETVTHAARVTVPFTAPLAHCSDGVDVEFFPPERVT